MKGLIRNNFYSVSGALKCTIGTCIAVNIVLLIAAIIKPENIWFLQVLMLGQIGAFVGITGTALSKDTASKWSRFEKTLPVKKRDIIFARYISFVIFIIMGILLATISLLVFSAIFAQEINFERISYAYGFGTSFALLVPAILYPLVLKLGSDKTEFLLMVSVLIASFLFIGGSFALAPYLKALENPNLIYRITAICVSIIAFIASYFTSYFIYTKKEL